MQGVFLLRMLFSFFKILHNPLSHLTYIITFEAINIRIKLSLLITSQI
jgi:hypothetical protein